MAKRNPVPQPRPPAPAASSFWHPLTFAELAAAQAAEPVRDIRELFGTWPGDPDDGFEDLIRSTRDADLQSECKTARTEAA